MSALCFCSVTWFLLASLLIQNGTVLTEKVATIDSDSDNGSGVNTDDFDILLKLAWSDLNIVHGLIQGVDLLRKKSQLVQVPQEVEEYIEDFRLGNGGNLSRINWTLETAKNITQNAISTIRLVYRYAVDLPKLLKLPLDGVFEQAKEAVVTESAILKWPDLADLKHGIAGLLKMQLVYDLTAEKMSQGRLAGIELGSTLDFRHCFEIGIHALELEQYVYAVEWLELALEKLKLSQGDPDVPITKDGKTFQQKIQTPLNHAIKAHDDLYQRTPKDEGLFLFDHPLISPKTKEVRVSSKRRTRRKVLMKRFTNNKDQRKILRWHLCAGKNFQTKKAKSRLFCWYEFQSHPRLLIGPVKKEFLSRDPDLVLMYDMVGESALKKLEKAFRGKRTAVLEEHSPNILSTVLTFGICRYIPDNDNILSLSKNLEASTGLKIAGEENAENLFMRSSSFSTFGILHLDFNVSAAGFREIRPISSALHYLSDVEAGGRTVFPVLGLSVQPVKGAVLMWYNKFRDGASDGHLLHMACPVIFGRKLVGNKWIHPHSNMFTLNCAKKPDVRFTVKVNGKETRR